MSRDVTFFETIPFSSTRTPLLGKYLASEEMSSLIPLPVLVPFLVPIYHFDGGGNGGEGEKEFQVYVQRKKYDDVQVQE